MGPRGFHQSTTQPHQSIFIARERVAGHIKVTYPLLIMVTAVITSTGVQVISITGIHRQIIIVHLVYCFNNYNKTLFLLKKGYSSP